jgi:hypothetical protein
VIDLRFVISFNVCIIQKSWHDVCCLRVLVYEKRRLSEKLLVMGEKFNEELRGYEAAIVLLAYAVIGK